MKNRLIGILIVFVMFVASNASLVQIEAINLSESSDSLIICPSGEDDTEGLTSSLDYYLYTESYTHEDVVVEATGVMENDSSATQQQTIEFTSVLYFETSIGTEMEADAIFASTSVSAEIGAGVQEEVTRIFTFNSAPHTETTWEAGSKTVDTWGTMKHWDPQCNYREYSASADYTYDMYSKIEEHDLND